MTDPSGDLTGGGASDPAGDPTSDPTSDARVERRADLLPEEVAAGSDDPDEQARQILQESDQRTEHPEETRRRSTQTPD